MTAKPSGHARVFGCAKARAVELSSTVAAVFLPCEEALGHRGIAGEIPAIDTVEGAGPLLIARGLPTGQIRALRAAGAEVWPGAWSAGHVTVGESCGPAAMASQEPVSETNRCGRDKHGETRITNYRYVSHAFDGIRETKLNPCPCAFIRVKTPSVSPRDRRGDSRRMRGIGRR